MFSKFVVSSIVSIFLIKLIAIITLYRGSKSLTIIPNSDHFIKANRPSSWSITD